MGVEKWERKEAIGAAINVLVINKISLAVLEENRKSKATFDPGFHTIYFNLILYISAVFGGERLSSTTHHSAASASLLLILNCQDI